LSKISVSFWGSGEGIGMRLGMLSSGINIGSNNNALQVLAPAYGVRYFKMAGPQSKCEYCIRYYGRIYRQMIKVYRLDCVQGVFGSKPDGNFERLLRVSSKILLNVSERDRYYRTWLGLAYVLAMEQYLDQLEAAEPKDLVFEIKRQRALNQVCR
jgi:hypothetical protein